MHRPRLALATAAATFAAAGVLPAALSSAAPAAKRVDVLAARVPLSPATALSAAGSGRAGAGALALAPQSASDAKTAKGSRVTNLVVIYQENHSFDNLFGTWGASAARPSRGSPRPRRCSAHRSPRTARRTAACCRTT